MHNQSRLLSREICFSDELSIRSTGIDAVHVRTLKSLYRNGVMVDPITVCRATPDAPCEYVLVDGLHRLAAFDEAFPNSNEGILCNIIEGSVKDAFMAALMANRKVSRSLTAMERVNAAWKIVRLFPEVSKKETVEATGVSRTTVGTMRARWRELQDAGKVDVSGNWMSDNGSQSWEPEEMSQEEFKRRATAMKRKFRQAAGKAQRYNFDLFATALVDAFTIEELKEVIRYIDDFEDAMANTDF